MDDSRIRRKTAPFSFENGLVWRGHDTQASKEFKKTTTATATGTSLNKIRFNEQNNSCARAL